MTNKLTIVHIPVIILFGMLAAVLLPLQAAADAPVFFSVQNIAGSLELAVDQRDTRRTSDNLNLSTDLKTSIERLRLAMDGYVYHPRFVIYRVGGALGLEQGTYTTNSGNTRTSQFFDEYDLSATLLPEHPYNLEVFKRRQMAVVSPLYPDQSVSASQGAIFRYRRSPFSLYLSAASDSFDNNESIDSKIYTARGSYLIGPFMNAAGYSRTESLSTTGTQADRTNSTISNHLKLNSLTLLSDVRNDRQVQDNPATASIGTESFLWSEGLSAKLPFNFSADYSHTYRRDEFTTQQMQSAMETATYNRTTADSIMLSHKLYNSLRTSVGANQSYSQSSGGDSEYSQASFALAYNKKIPLGSFNAGYNVNDMVSTRTGAAAITNELHVTQAPGGSFTLNNQAVDQSTIIVMVKDPVSQNLMQLTPNVHYQILQFGNMVQILVGSLPASIALAPSYEFLVTYSLLSNDSKIETRTNSVNFGFNFLKGLFSPYVSHSTTNQEIISGQFFSGADSTTTSIYGYSVHRDPFSLLYERTDFQSRLSPYRSMRTSVEYRQPVHDNADVSTRFSYSESVHPSTPVSIEYAEHTTSLEATAHKAFPGENLNLFVGGNYTMKSATGASFRSYLFNPNLKWHVGMLDVTATASRTYTVSTGVTTANTTYQEDAFHLMVSRKIF